ncbi:MAG: hypothetical protein ACE5QV_08490, partial [Fidelibacterota bacterium]
MFKHKRSGNFNSGFTWIIVAILIFPHFSQISWAQFLPSRLEFRTPFTLTVFEIKAGGGLFFKDNAHRILAEEGQPPYRQTFVYSLEIFKINLPYFIIKQNLLDFQTGFGINYISSIVANGMPAKFEWPEKFEMAPKFEPRIMEYNINETIIYQLKSNLTIFSSLGFGRGTATVYGNKKGQRYLEGKTNTFSWAGGVRYTKLAEGKSKISLSVEARYMNAFFAELDDPDDVSPFKSMNMSNFSLTFSVGLAFGGDRTVGDRGEENFKNGDYISAKVNYSHFLDFYPSHPRAKFAKKRISQCIREIPYQLKSMGDVSLSAGNYEQALSYYNEALLLQ